MDETKIAKFRSDYDPECILTIIKNIDGDIILDINKKMSSDGTEGEFRIAMSGGKLEGRRKTLVVSAFEKIISAFNAQEEGIEDRKRLESLDMGAVYREIGKRIKHYRNVNCLTQQELSDKLGVDRSTVAVYEIGRQGMPIERLYEIADLFELTIYDFLPEFSADNKNFVRTFGQNTHNTV